jgi:DNA polymerase-3 subunit beta
VYFEIGARTLVARLLSGVFPNYEMVIPKDNDNKVEFDCAALLQIVRRVSVMTDERSRAMRLEFTKNKLTVRSEEDEQGAAEESVEIEYKGAPTVIGINSAYLSEYLSVLGGGAIRFEFKDGKTQVQIRPLGEAGYNSFNIIMPMNLGDATPSAPSATATEEKTQTQEEDAPVAQAA